MRLFFAIAIAFFSLNSSSQIIINEYSAANYDDFNGKQKTKGNVE